jgi:hypothetical protein
LLVVVIIAAIGITVWRVSTARRIAEEAGLDPGRATAVTLFGSPGLDATYVAASLKHANDMQHPSSPRPASSHPPDWEMHPPAWGTYTPGPETHAAGPGTHAVGPETHGPGSEAVAERLRELAELRDQGLITPEEYAARRTSIIGSL